MTKRLHCGSSKIPEISKGERDSESSASEYGVFLSFRGPDSRQGLADVLYSDMTTAGIRVFRDNDELDVGDMIRQILPAIKSSKICVPIFSKTFSASAWCLREVEAMVELGKKIMPIFYTATPDDLKLRTELFKEDMRKHEEKYGAEQVKKWEDALKAVGKIIGREVKSTGLAEFSKSFVRTILIKLKVNMKNVTEFLVRRDHQEEALLKLLDINADDVRVVVGIHGMGGIGKTTLAKVVFNQTSAKFDSCSFLENLQEPIKRIEYLERKLLEDLDPKMKDFQDTNPVTLLKQNFRHKKVLIILDDVHERKHVEIVVELLDSFGAGSRIIITTRDKRVFTKETRALEVQELNEDEALQLFSRHAFRKESPPSDYRILSNEIICLTGRLPLALEVIGSLLYGCEKRRWKVTIEKLKKVPNRNVQEKLKLSFDELEYEHKQIFLDIACFFVDKETSGAMYMWEACELFPEDGIDVLISMSLLKIEGNNRFWMHDLVRDLGRALIRETCPDEPSKWSRIWSHTEALEVLKIKKGKGEVKGLFLGEPYGGTLTNTAFSGFGKLRLLKLVGTKLAGDFEHDFLPWLRWFSWHQSPLDFPATNLSLEKLVVLDLSGSNITESWTGWILLQVARNLKVLDLTDCCNLESTPDLSNNEGLERLILRGCQKLAQIHASIGMLKSLKHLDLKGCSSLGGIPEEFGSLENLEEILVEGKSDQTFHVPQSIGNLRSLTVLKLSLLKITGLPRSIGGLVSLTRLILFACGVSVLPDEIGDLKSLLVLSVVFTKLSMLPNSIGQLGKLQQLHLVATEIEELPDSLGDLKSLETLDPSSSKLRILPDSVGDLSSLRVLNLFQTEVSVLPDSVGQLAKLQTLNVSATKVEKLPHSLGDLRSLETLILDHSVSLTILPDSVGNLESLLQLSLNKTRVSVLPNSTGRLLRLQRLDLGSTMIEELPDSLGALRSLEILNLGESQLRVLPKWVGDLKLLLELDLRNTEVSVLPDSIGQLDKLSSLNLESTKIRGLPDSLGGLISLKTLDVSNTKVSFLPHSIGQLEKLRVLRLNSTRIEALPDSLSALKTLKILDLKDSLLRVLPEWVGDLKSLSELNVSGTKVGELPSTIGNVSSLKELYVTARSAAKFSTTVGHLTSLEMLAIEIHSGESGSGDTSLATSLDLGASTLLQTLELDCLGFKCIAQLPPLLYFLVLSRVSPETRLPDLSNLRDLQRIDFRDCSLRDVRKMESLRDLQVLDVMEVINCSKELVQFCCRLENVRSLTIRNPESCEEVFDFSLSKNLEDLTLQNCKELVQIRGLSELVKLRTADCDALVR